MVCEGAVWTGGRMWMCMVDAFLITGLYHPLSVPSVWSLVRDHAAYVQPSSWRSWGPKWCCWRRETPSQGTMCCTYGPSLSRTSGALGPRSSMESSVLVLSIISVSIRDKSCFPVLTPLIYYTWHTYLQEVIRCVVCQRRMHFWVL